MKSQLVRWKPSYLLLLGLVAFAAFVRVGVGTIRAAQGIVQLQHVLDRTESEYRFTQRQLYDTAFQAILTDHIIMFDLIAELGKRKRFTPSDRKFIEEWTETRRPWVQEWTLDSIKAIRQRGDSRAEEEKLRELRRLVLSESMKALALIVAMVSLLAWSLDAQRPGYHYDHASVLPQETVRHFLQLLAFVQYGLVVTTSFGSTDIRPTSWLARMLSCFGSLIGIVTILLLLAVAIGFALSK